MTTVEVKQKLATLHPGMAADEFERVKSDLVSAFERCAEFTFGQGGETTHAKLSRRENEVMSMMLEGRRLKEIAARLDISVKTVTTHRSRLLKKLKVEDNLGLYRYGIRNGLISV